MAQLAFCHSCAPSRNPIYLLRRAPELPDTPTLAESGFDGIDVTFWYGLLAPHATPPATLRALFDVVEQILRAPDAARSIAQQGMVVMAEPPDIFTARI